MNLADTLLSETSQSQQDKYCDFTHGVPRALTSIETESRMVGVRGRGEG